MIREPIKIAIVDSGINQTILGLNEQVKKTEVYRISQNGFVDVSYDSCTQNTHGTIISLIVREIFRDIEFHDINILDNKLSTDSRMLMYVLERVVKSNIDIVHLSLGTRNLLRLPKLLSLINKASRNGTIIIAAADNTGRISFPAYLKNVIGVKGDQYLESGCYYKNGFVYAPLSSKYALSNYDIDNKMIYSYGTSFSAAYITGHVAKIIYTDRKSSSKEIIKSF